MKQQPQGHSNSCLLLPAGADAGSGVFSKGDVATVLALRTDFGLYSITHANKFIHKFKLSLIAGINFGSGG